LRSRTAGLFPVPVVIVPGDLADPGLEALSRSHGQSLLLPLDRAFAVAIC
jgi:hypothetical protein